MDEQLGLDNSELEEREADLPVSRAYAEFHRRLGELMMALCERSQVLWAGDVLKRHFSAEELRFTDTTTGHELHPGETAVKNVYRKGIYLISEAGPYQPVLAELRRIQREVMTLSGARRPYDGLLEPSLLTEVDFVRLRSQTVNLDRKLGLEALTARLDKRIAQVRVNARLFEAVDPHDAASQRLHQEIKHLENVKHQLETSGEPKFLERTRRLRVTPTVYQHGQPPREVYLRDVGLVLAGPAIKVDVPVPYRRQRSDRVTRELIAPLATFENVAVYSYRVWQERVKKSGRKPGGES